MNKAHKQNVEYINKLVDEENVHMAHLNRIVVDSLQEEDCLVRKIFKSHRKEHVTFSEKLADKVALFGGSWKAIILFTTLIVTWILINNSMSNEAFDPYPFILLNLILSCLAVFQAPIILMSQNRGAEKERKRSEHEYLINLKAELQTRELNSKIDLIITEQMSGLLSIQKTQLESLNHLKEKLKKLDKFLNKKPSN
jgi:uncharacterized membrane protein